MNRGVIDYAHEVMRASQATGRRRLVLLALALHADDRGHARPSAGTLGEWAGISRWNAFDALRWLVDAGELECVKQSRGGRPSEYRILLNRPADEAVEGADRPANEAVPPTNRPADEAVDAPTASPTASLTASHTGQEHKARRNNRKRTPKPGDHELDNLTAQVAKILADGLDFLPPNDHGRPWPQPDLATIRRALAEHQASPFLARRVAEHTKLTVQDQGRAPNIAGLFAHKLADAYSDERKQVRQQIDQSLASAGADR